MILCMRKFWEQRNMSVWDVICVNVKYLVVLLEDDEVLRDKECRESEIKIWIF